MNREGWLNEAATAMLVRWYGLWKSRFGEEGLRRLSKVAISVGFTSDLYSDGETWPPESTSDGSIQIFVAPWMEEPLHVLGVLLHELIHAAGAVDHEGVFADFAAELGFVEPWDEGRRGYTLDEELREIAQDLGAYPHKRLNCGDLSRFGAVTIQPLTGDDDTLHTESQVEGGEDYGQAGPHLGRLSSAAEPT